MIFGVPINVLPAAAVQRLEATLARLDPRTMTRAKGSRPIGSFQADPIWQRDRQRQSKARRTKRTAGSSELFGVALTFNTRSSHSVTVPEALRKLIGTGCSGAHVTYKPGAFDRTIREAVIGSVRDCVRLELFHDREMKLCSTISGALQLRASEKALTFTVRATSRDGRRAVRMATLLASTLSGAIEVSAGFCPLVFDWNEPKGLSGTGEMIVHKARLNEISLLDHGAHGGIFAFVI